MQTEITNTQRSFDGIILLSADLEKGAAGIIDQLQELQKGG